MSKIGATAVLAAATLAGSVSAQACASAQSGLESRCHGPEDVHKKVCCPGLECVQKDQWYGQCRKVGIPVPEGWSGTILDYSGSAAVEEVGTTEEAGTAEEDVTMEEVGTMEDTPADAMEEAPGTEGPAPVDDVKYMAVIAKDYIPNADVPTMVLIEDLPIEVGGNVVADQKACEELCTETEGCNAASFYAETPFDTELGRNCWLKFIGDSCELPADALDDPNAVFLLQITDECEDPLAVLGPAGGPEDAMGPDAFADGPLGMMDGMAPMGTDEEPTPLTPVPSSPQSPITGVTGRSAPPTVETDASSAYVSVRGFMVALAVAGVAVAAF